MKLKSKQLARVTDAERLAYLDKHAPELAAALRQLPRGNVQIERAALRRPVRRSRMDYTQGDRANGDQNADQ